METFKFRFLIAMIGFSLVVQSTSSMARMSCDGTPQDQPGSKASPYAQNLFSIYSTYAYEVLNNQARQTFYDPQSGYDGRIYPGDFSLPELKLYHQLHRVLCRLPNAKQTTTFRGINMPADQVQQKYKVGNVIRELAFLSTTADRDVALNKFTIPPNIMEPSEVLPATRVLIEIVGHSGKDIAAYSELPEEKEVLFNTESVFRVDKVAIDPKDGFWIISMHELDASKLTDKDKDDIAKNDENHRAAMVDKYLLPELPKNVPPKSEAALKIINAKIKKLAANSKSQLDSFGGEKGLFKEDLTQSDFISEEGGE